MIECYTIQVYAEAKDLYPTLAHEEDAGWDICSAENVWFQPGERKWVRTGMALQLPLGGFGSILHGSRGPVWDVQVRARGSTWSRGFNTHFGTGDGLFTSEYMVGLEWTGKERELLKRGTRIAQLVFNKLYTGFEVQWAAVDSPFPSRRGWNGSSGV